VGIMPEPVDGNKMTMAITKDNVTTMITADDIQSLKHMLGATSCTPRQRWGYRNYYAAAVGSKAEESMKRLAAVGFVRLGPLSPYHEGDIVYYCATETGCIVAGLNEKQTKRTIESK